MSTPIPTPESLLARAADILDEKGWYQGSWSGNNGCLCAWGAINVAVAEAAGNSWSEENVKPPDETLSVSVAEVYMRALDAVENLIGHRDVAGWNDAPGRTKPEVQELLRRAAEAGEPS